MKLTTQVKLILSNDQKELLSKTMKEFNLACSLISEFAFETNTFRQYDIHDLTYYMIRDCLDLSSQMVIRAISKVCDSYKAGKMRKRKYRTNGSVVYDSRVLTWKDSSVSVWTLQGRIDLPFVCGDRQKEQLEFQKGETDLIFKNGEYYLYTTCDIPEKAAQNCQEFLGIDVGVVNIATDNLANIYSGAKVNALRRRHLKLRAKLQSKGTKSCKRLLKRRNRKEMRFAKNENHRISKKIVETAQRHNFGIALEGLKGITKRVTVTKGQRYQLKSWSFHDLQQKIYYKAKKEGLEVVMVDPRNSSRECSMCGHTEKSNRKTQSLFSCLSCGYTVHADYNASCVISRRAVVNRPNVVG